MNRAIYFSRIALFVIYFWFGILKVFKLSPATPLVLSLLDRTIPFMEAGIFLTLFGLFEVLVGILFLIPKFKKVALILLALHMVMVWSPLLLLPSMTWQGFLIPSLEGQYIVKNLLIIAIALNIASFRKSS